MKTLELYENDVLVLILKRKETFHNYTNKGIDRVTQIYLLTSSSKELKQKRLDTDEFLGVKK